MRLKLTNYLFLALLAIIAVHLFLLARLIFFPYPELFIYPYLTARGLIPYQQILDQHFPGLMFFPINLYTLGMTTPEAARLWQFGVVATTHVLLFLVAKKFLKSGKWALLVNLLYLLWQPFFEGYVLWIDSFIPLLLLPSFYFLIRWQRDRKRRDIFWSGLFMGLALLFKQVVAPLAVLTSLLILIFSRKLKPFLVFALAFSIPAVFLVAYILKLGIWQDFFYWTVTFNLTTFAQMGRKYPRLLDLIKSLPVFGSAFFALIWLFKKKRKNFIWLGSFLIGSLFFAYARFDFIHLQPALPFALLALVLLIKDWPARILKPAMVLFIAASFIFVTPFYKGMSKDTVLFYSNKEKQLAAKLLSIVVPGHTIFALATTPHIYQMTNTLPPGRVFVFQFPWFMVEAEEKVLEGLRDNPPKVIIAEPQATTGGIKLVSYMPQIDNFVKRNYERVDKIGQIEILLPKEELKE